MMSLTRKQKRCLEVIRQYGQETDGGVPTLEVVKQRMGLASKSGVHAHFQALVERGYLRKTQRTCGRATYRLTPQGTPPPAPPRPGIRAQYFRFENGSFRRGPDVTI